MRNVSFPVLVVLAVVVGGLVVAQGTVHAATLSLKPKTVRASVGMPLTMRLVLASADRSVNSAEATIAFSKKLLAVKKVTTKGSIFAVWAKKPTGFNKTGTVVFAAGKKNPGFKGKGATVLRITFVPKKTGTASVNVTKASVLANDGKGTNVLTKVKNAKMRIR